MSKLISPGHPDYPPADVIAAAEKVGTWFANRNQKGWQLGPCADRFGTSSGQAELDAALRQEVLTMYQLLDDGEWAEHIAGTPHGQCLETAITKLVGTARAPAPASGSGDVGGEAPVAWLRFWAAQRYAGHGNIETDDGLEVCEPGDVGADGSPAFPVYAAPIATSAPESATSGATSAATLKDILDVTLWLYQRLPAAYGCRRYVETAIISTAGLLGADVSDALSERAALVASAGKAE